jgi:preprotein translocase subunit SecD
VQDTAKAKDILGRTATLEIRMVDDSPGALEAAQDGTPPFGTEVYTERGGQPLLVKKQVVLTGDRRTDAQPGFDGQTNEAAVHLTLDSAGARIFKDITRENVNKRMAILLIEKGKGEVVTAPVIRTEIGGGRVQISGRMTTQEASDTALLLRAGSLAAPMDIIEERTIGPSLGAENIEKGFNSTLWGFAAIAVFMVLYYQMFGVISVLALASNLLFLENVIAHPLFRSGECTTRFIDETPDLFKFQHRRDRATRLLKFLGDVTVNGNPEMKGRVLPKLPLAQPRVQLCRVRIDTPARRVVAHWAVDGTNRSARC